MNLTYHSVHLQPLVWIDHCGQGEGWKVYSRPACTGVTKTILSKMKNQGTLFSFIFSLGSFLWLFKLIY